MNIGMVSTRLAGTDGVSLEATKMATALRRMGHQVFYCAGELDGDVPGTLAPELHFTDATAVALSQHAFSREGEDAALLADIATRAGELQQPLRQFIRDYRIDYIIAQNVFAIPMQLPLAQALADVLRDTNLPALAHNHDLYWERERFATNCVGTLLDTYFPPDLPRLRHATINSLAQKALRARRGIDSVLLPNVFDFETPPPAPDAYSADFRAALGLRPDDWLILQPTRVIPRKGIELAVELVARLDDPRAKLVITHHAGDEGLDYLHALQRLARERDVDLRYVADIVDDQRGRTGDGRKVYSLWDTYPHADFVTYPSFIEGFGNALIETVYFRLPALVNRYAVYAADIGPKGFKFVEIDGTLTATAVATVRRWLTSPTETRPIVAHNYQLGLRHYSYQTLSRLLAPLLA